MTLKTTTLYINDTLAGKNTNRIPNAIISS